MFLNILFGLKNQIDLTIFIYNNFLKTVNSVYKTYFSVKKITASYTYTSF